MRSQRICKIVFGLSLAFLIGFPGQLSATIINGTITGIATGFSEGSQTGEAVIFGPGAVGSPVIVNYRFNTDNAPVGDLASSTDACSSVATGRCTHDADRAVGSEFITAEIIFNGVEFSMTNPRKLATSGLIESTLAIENNLNPRNPNIERDHIDIRIDSTDTQVIDGVSIFSVSQFNTNLFRASGEGLTSNLSLTQTVDWDLIRDEAEAETFGSNDALFSFAEVQTPSQFGNGGNDRVYGVNIGFNITNWQQSAVSDLGTTPENPVLPVDENDDGFTFDAPVNSGDLLFIDPFIAIGYDYETGDNDPNFASVLLPDVGDGVYDLILFDQDGNNPFDTGIDILAGVEFDFTTELFADFQISTEGISKFGIRGIEISAGLDPDDQNAFVTGLSFVDSGQFTGTMTPVTEFVQAPEPGMIALFGIGVVGLGFMKRRRKAI